MADRESLSRLKRWHWYVPILIVISLGLLIAGWSLPTLKLTKAIFFTSTYSIWAGITELWKSEHYILAGVIFFFSMIFPTAKLLGLMSIWFAPLTREIRNRYLNLLEILGRWSMLDVFVVSILIVLIKAADVADANASIGIYFFAGAVMLSMLTANIIYKMARS